MGQQEILDALRDGPMTARQIQQSTGYSMNLYCNTLDLNQIGDLCEECAGWLRGSMKVRG